MQSNFANALEQMRLRTLEIVENLPPLDID